MKNKIFKKFAAISLTIALAVGAVGCGQSSAAKNVNKKEANDTDHLNVAIMLVPGYLPLYLLKDSGDLEKALKDYNVKVTYKEFQNGPEENESFAAGEIDTGVMGNVPGISGIAAGQKRSIIGISYNGEKAHATLVRDDSGINSLSDLKGKKIGLVIGSMEQELLDKQLESAGLTESDVQLVNLGTGEQESALINGQVDALTIWDPYLTKTLANDGVKVLADGTGFFKGENVILANTDYAKKNPDIIKIFLDEYKKAASELKENPEEYAKKYSSSMGLTEDEFVKSLANINLPVDITDEDITDLQGTADYLYKTGLIKKEVKISDAVIK